LSIGINSADTCRTVNDVDSGATELLGVILAAVLAMHTVAGMNLQYWCAAYALNSQLSQFIYCRTVNDLDSGATKLLGVILAAVSESHLDPTNFFLHQ
jgi:hypothetical protein